jgi:hypothetical protein
MESKKMLDVYNLIKHSGDTPELTTAKIIRLIERDYIRKDELLHEWIEKKKLVEAINKLKCWENEIYFNDLLRELELIEDGLDNAGI